MGRPSVGVERFASTSRARSGEKLQAPASRSSGTRPPIGRRLRGERRVSTDSRAGVRTTPSSGPAGGAVAAKDAGAGATASRVEMSPKVTASAAAKNPWAILPLVT